MAVEDGNCAGRIAEDAEECFDWVLLDRHMPGADGPTTARALRQCPATRDARLVLLVNDADEAAAAAGLVDRVLVRPDGARGLRDLLAGMLAATVPVPDRGPGSLPRPGAGPDPRRDAARGSRGAGRAARPAGARRNRRPSPPHAQCPAVQQPGARPPAWIDIRPGAGPDPPGTQPDPRAAGTAGIRSA
ncbi:MAG: hypothetical protein U5R48_13080 [Gammaproteobacteria bacterium]|nr:hypothetical protein [Gammaproteobacteria bacterium]